MGLRESFLTPSSAIKENFDNMIVSKARLIDYTLSFGIDLFFKTILGHYRSFLNRNGTSALPLSVRLGHWILSPTSLADGLGFILHKRFCP